MKKLVIYTLMALLAVLVFSAGCRGCQKGSSVDVPPQCGECLQLRTGEVCTAQGTMKNSCLAICVGAKILCNGTCPCADAK